jgi:hypothetical protein
MVIIRIMLKVKTMKNLKYSLLLLCLGIWSLNVQAQVSEDITVKTKFDAKLNDAKKYDLQPKFPKADTVKNALDYDIVSKLLEQQYDPPKIRPIAYKLDKLQKEYKGMAKLGAGNPNTLLGQIQYRDAINKQLIAGLEIDHLGSKNKNIANQNFRETAANINGSYYAKQGFQADGKIGLNSRDFYYYAYNFIDSTAGLEIESPDALQRYTKFDVAASIKNAERTVLDFNYGLGFDFYRLTDNYSSNEIGFNVELNAQKWFQEKSYFNVDIETDLTRFEDTSIQNLHNFFIRPAFLFQGSVFNAKVGANLGFSNDVFFPFPDVNISYELLDFLTLFAGAEGTLYKNNLNNTSLYNPYINTTFNIQNTSIYHFFAGVKGNVGVINYDVQAGVKRANDLALFLDNPILENGFRRKFEVLYDTATIFNINGTINTKEINGISFGGTVDLNTYSLRVEEKPWHLPTFSLNGFVKYTGLDNNLQVKADLFMENGIPYLNELGEADNQNALFDLSVSADYFFSDNIGIFIQLNNLANNKRIRWNGYENYGLNIIGGINARF